MLSGLTPKELARARWIAKPDNDQGHVSVILPMVLDGVNARVLRKLVLMRLPDCHALRFDASQLKVLGRVGAASLWQILQIAERHGTRVHLVSVSDAVSASLNKVKVADSKRRAFFQASEKELDIVVKEPKNKKSSGKTLVITREGAESRDTAVIEREEPKKRWSERVVLKLISRSRRDAA